MFTLNSLGASALGLVIGYVFSWSSKSQAPNGTEVASLISAVFGGTVLSTLQQFGPSALPMYAMGVAGGYAAYLAALQFNLTKIASSMSRGVISRNPLFPWRLERPCSVEQCPHFNMQPPRAAASSGCCGGACKS